MTKTRIAILGGGPSGLSAAFWLTATPELQARFEVTVHTPGWRLGGKCASGRDDDGRIREHGLHVLMGCYRNVFATICATYAQWQPPADGAIRTWDQAFTPQHQVTLTERDSNGAWGRWNFKLPGNGTHPCAGGAPTSLADLIAELGRRIRDWLLGLSPLAGNDVAETMDAFVQLVQQGTAEQAEDLRARLQRLETAMEPLVGDFALQQFQAFDASAGAPLVAGLDGVAAGGRVLLSLGMALMRGYLSDVFLRGEQGIAELNEEDFRGWLRRHGASEEALRSAPIRALYHLTFAFPDGDSSDIDGGAIAAGVTFRFAMEAALGYAGAPLWKMNAGTGDILFTPMYEVLRQRGVHFRFFHRVSGIAAGADGRIARVSIAEQARTVQGDYQPLRRVEGLHCWPAQPLWEQLQDGEAMKDAGVDFESPGDTTKAGDIELVAGQDFDAVVLATPPEVTRTISAPLAGIDGRWDRALAHSRSVGTTAFQLWLRPGLQDLGWPLGSTVLSAYQPPFESWGDMSHLVTREPPTETRTIAYFCGCIAAADEDAAGHGMAAWLRQHIGVLWPQAAQVADANGDLDPQLVEQHYTRINVAGSERYVLTPPGSVKYRLSPREAIFGRLYVAGDWTATRFSGGCVEAAFESGQLAAAAIRRDLP